MKIIKHTLRLCLLVMVFYGCSEDDANTSFVEAIEAPINISANVVVTQDNTGLVTITPLGEGVANYVLNFGDGSETSDPIQPGKSINHTYEEGIYEASVIAYGLNGLSTAVAQTIVVSFQAPENLVVTIENDNTISRQVNITASADFAISYNVDFGNGSEPLMANNGETINYVYPSAGTYTITVTAFSAAIETTEYVEDFLVTEILTPTDPAPSPTQSGLNVISVFSDVFTDPDPIDYYPNWGQSTTYTQIDVDGDAIIQYGDLTYQGIDFSTVPIDASQMEFIHVDIYTVDEDFDAKISPISGGPNEAAYDLELTAGQWNSFDIPISYFTDLNPLVDFSNIIQFKLEGVPSGSGTIFVDNLYFYKTPTITNEGLEGVWKLAPVAGALGVGPAVGDVSWFACDDACVTDRACYYDDEYVFNADGTFTNNLGAETWIEGWQGGGDACGTPVAPYDGSNTATYVYDETAGTVTLNGIGAYLGLAKANNDGELPNVGVPNSITYNVTFTGPHAIDVFVESGAGVFWQYKLVRDAATSNPLAGTWQMAEEAGSLAVGPAAGDTSWFSCDTDCVTMRACYFDDTYVFGSDGSFTNSLGAESWIEGWQGGGDACGTPVAPHDGSNAATYVYDEDAGTITIDGLGAYIGIPKANNEGELPNVAVPTSITYNVTFTSANAINVYVESGPGVFWQYKLVKN